MSEYGWTNKGNSKKSPSEEVGDALSDAFAWPENAIDYMNGWNFATIVARQSCRLVCWKEKCLSGCGGTFANGMNQRLISRGGKNKCVRTGMRTIVTTEKIFFDFS
jgi:hypothetical protein